MAAYYIKKTGSAKPGFRKILKITGIGFLVTGSLFFLYFFFPVLSYHFFLANAYPSGQMEVPIPKYLVANRNNDLEGLLASSITSLTSDFTDARNWYPNLSPQKVNLTSYLISIPRLKIENAEVSTQDYDLERHLVQYLGTSIPGEKGTAVIFGHSTLPQLFNPENYKTIFANAHNLKIGDELFINVNDIVYKYKIFSIVITDPEDTNILSQSFDHSYVTLVTCTPPGTIWKRFVVRASFETVVN
jgi:sortase A